MSLVEGAVNRLLIRGDDLVVLGVRWSGLRLIADAGGRGRLEAGSAGGQVTLIFPPQAVAETKYEDDLDVSRRAARLAGPSAVAFSLPAGAMVELTIAGLLAALGSAGASVVENVPTGIELPWHLTLAPQAAGVSVVSRHAALPATSPGGVIGLWHAPIRARRDDGGDAELELLPLEADQDDSGLEVRPLSGQQRQSIVDVAKSPDGPLVPRARRLELSALGGSLTAELSAPSLEWSHRTSLGRDHYVRVAEHGVLFPFGHRAVYIETAERAFHPDSSPAVAGMRRRELLLVTEPVRSTADGDLGLRRSFPFSEVEVLTTCFPDIKPPEAADCLTMRRPVEPHGQLGEELDQMATARRQLVSEVEQSISEQPVSLAAFMEAEMGRTPELNGARGELGAIGDPTTWEAANESIRKAINALEDLLQPQFGPDGELISPDQSTVESVRQQQAELETGLHSPTEIAQARQEQDRLIALIGSLEVAVREEFEAIPRTVEQAAARGDQRAAEAEDLRRRIEALNARIAEIAVTEEDEHQLGFLPRTRDGQPLRIPLRCAGAGADVFLELPMVFVKDFSLREEEFFPEFHSLTDSDAIAKVRAAWAEHATVELPGVSIDMVGDVRPQPGDVQEVHSLTLAGVSHQGGFRPRVTEFDVVMPTLRALLPETGGRNTLSFTEAFLSQERIPEVPFAFDPEFAGNPGPGLRIDFVENADRSGGLVAPKFDIDGISRSLGPVATGALPPKLAAAQAELPEFDLASVYEGATLLGFPLASLMKLPPDLSAAGASVPLPPEVKQLAEDGLPTGMRMSWTLDLAEHGPFRPGPATKLALSVEHSATKHETTCTVNDFALILPPGGSGDGLLQLRFRSLSFSQHEALPPELKIEGLQLTFGGALRLLQDLQKELQKAIGDSDNLPKVEVRPNGLHAGYGVSAPHVSAGAFQLTNVAMHAGVDVPFDGQPVTVTLSFASRDDPFNVSVLTFGGGGYLEMTIGPEGLRRLEASIEFGASLEVDFFVAKGEVHALGGIRFRQAGGAIDIDGFLRIGGSVEVLGLVSASIELVVTLSYRDGNRLVGRATIVLEIDLTLFSESVEIDSGEWVLAGSEIQRKRIELDEPQLEAVAGAAGETDAGALEAWRAYREAFSAA